MTHNEPFENVTMQVKGTDRPLAELFEQKTGRALPKGAITKTTHVDEETVALTVWSDEPEFKAWVRSFCPDLDRPYPAGKSE